MAMVPDVKVKVTADTTGLDKALGGAQSNLARFAKIGAAGAAAVGAGLFALTKRAMDNADAMAKQARSLGLANREYQRLSLVAKEAGVEMGQLGTMLQTMQRGIAGNVDAFGALGVSIADIRGQSPEAQFAAIAEALDRVQDPAQKTALAMQVFGRSGRDAINMLTDYRAKAADAAAFQERFGIAIGELATGNIERANDAVGRLGQVMDGLGNRLATAVAPAVERTANAIVSMAEALLGAKIRADEFFGSIELAKAVLGEDLVNKMLGAPDKVRENAAAIESVVGAVEDIAGALFRQTIPAMETFSDILRATGDTANANIFDAMISELTLAGEKFVEGKITAEEFDAIIAQAQERADALAGSLRGVNGVGFDAVISGLSNLGEAIRQRAAEAAALGAAFGMDVPTELAPEGFGDVPVWTRDDTVTKTRARAAPATDALGGNTSNRGGGARNPLQQRLEALMEALSTEREILAEWYTESQATLQAALDARLLTETEYMDARERLEQEHQDRLAQIRELANQGALSSVLSAGEEILGALGATNKKALRVAKVFGAAQARISAYQGAAEALKLPFPKNLAAAATVLAKGIGFVQAIKGVNEGGTTSGGRGGGAATGGAAASPTQTLNFTVQNDPFGFGANIVRQIATQLNESARNGSTIRATVRA
jgi:hypothetical protein